MEHNPKECGCSKGEPCSCPCDKCKAYREREQRINRLMELDARLKRNGIETQDLVDLLWFLKEQEIEARIEQIATEVLQRRLKGVTLVSQVKGTWE